MKCPSCGYENSDDAQYCSLCQKSFVKAEPEPDIYQRGGDLHPVSKRPKPKRPLFFYRMVRFGFPALGLLILVVFLVEMAILFLPNNLDCAAADCPAVDDATFKWQVLEEPMPVLVTFCPEVLWHRVNQEYDPEIEYYRQPLPTVMAVRSIIRGGEFEGRVKFYKYYISSSELNEDPVAVEYGIKSSLEAVLFKDGAVIGEIGGTCCTPRERKEEIETALRAVLEGDIY